MVNKVKLLTYKYRYLILYTIFGGFSILIESALRNILSLIFGDFFTNILSILISIFVAYFLNINFNFKVPKDRIRISIAYFFLVSIASFGLQYTVGSLTNLDFFQNRFLLSGCLFIFAYFLHRKLTFQNYQKLGIAIHLNDDIDEVDTIYNQIGNYPDFIHIDLIDETYNKNNIAVNLEKFKKIVQTWDTKKIQVHIMSRKPSIWINKLAEFDVEIFFHAESDENSFEIKKLLEEKKIGIVLNKKIKDKDLKKILKEFSNIMVLTINKPGESGQKFNLDYDKYINNLVLLSGSYGNKITLDGGMTPNVASNYDVEEVVSASSVLNNNNSKFQIINFQTSRKYFIPDEK